MKILIAGSHGLLGEALTTVLEEDGNEVVALVRNDAGDHKLSWHDIAKPSGHELLDGFDAIVHLGGTNIGEKRWNAERKQSIYQSRVETTGVLSRAIAQMVRKPEVFVCASAVGYYGDTGDVITDESANQGSGFLAELTADWEGACQPARDADVRVVNLRTGVVLSRNGGMLKRLEQVFMMAMGGRLGSGQQWMSWISLRDAVDAIVYAIQIQSVRGPINLCAPNPITNAEFTQIFSDIINRPAPVPVYPWMLNLTYGKEMTQEMLLVSQRVVPAALTNAGFEFRFPVLKQALESIYKD